MNTNSFYIAPEVKEVYDMLCLKAVEFPKDVIVLTQVGSYMFLLDYYPFEARSFLEKAVMLDPTNIDARFWLALSLYHDACDYRQARELLYETLKLAPTRADCLSLLAYAIRGIEGSTVECLECLRSAIKFAPDWTLPRRVLIQIYTWQGEFVLAEKEIEKLAAVVKSMDNKDIEVKNDIEDYYERCVTGRFTISRNVEALEEQIEELNRTKLGVNSKDKNTTAIS